MVECSILIRWVFGFGGILSCKLSIELLYNLVYLRIAGATVEKEEKEFREIVKEEFNEESGELTNKLLSNWHKKMYRQFPADM
ncbi:hypothetical protein BH20BAC1_BH20BAC1_24940 [soil metagenome]